MTEQEIIDKMKGRVIKDILPLPSSNYRIIFHDDYAVDAIHKTCGHTYIEFKEVAQ